MRVALYLRRSTDENLQADSIAAQLALLTQFAAEQGYAVIDEISFRDNASGRTAKRPGFQRLIEVVQNGAPFEAVLVRDVSRWGRFNNIDEAAFWEFYFNSHGVRVIYVEERFHENDPYVAIEKMLRRFVASEFSRDKARLVQFGEYRTALGGFWHGGPAPYGMERVLVKPDGEIIQRLKRGELKAVSANKIKLIEGDSGEVAAVRKVFDLFVRKQLSISSIAKRMARSHGGRFKWLYSNVRRMLRSAAYAGISAGTFSSSENFAEPRHVSVAAAWPGIISLSTWESAQERLNKLEMQTRLPVMLARFAREVNGAAIDETAASDYFSSGGQNSFLSRHPIDVEKTRAELLAALRRQFDVVESGDAFILDGSLRLGIKSAYPTPRGYRLKLKWEFPFDGTETFDVAVGIALAPLSHVLCYFLICKQYRRSKERLGPRGLLSWTSRVVYPGKVKIRSAEQMCSMLKSYAFFRYGSSIQLFYETIRTMPLARPAQAARDLGWPEHQGRCMYRRLRALGYVLPPLKKQHARVQIICADCGKRRSTTVTQAIKVAEAALCRQCTRARSWRTITCPDCGESRSLQAGVIRRYSNGTQTRCGPCARRTNLKRSADRRRGHFTLLTVTCPDCGKKREKPRYVVRRLSAGTDSRCRACQDNFRKARLEAVRCPDCGKTRWMKVWVARQLSNGSNTRCKLCTAKFAIGSRWSTKTGAKMRDR